MTQDEIDKIVKELKDVKSCCDCIHFLNYFCLRNHSVVSCDDVCHGFTHKEQEFKINTNWEENNGKI